MEVAAPRVTHGQSVREENKKSELPDFEMTIDCPNNSWASGQLPVVTPNLKI